MHSGTYRAFVYDIADLYKADLSIPVAFDVAALGGETPIGTEARRRVRDAVRECRLLEQAVRDIKALLALSGDPVDADDDDEALIVDDLHLWDDFEGTVAAGVSYEERSVT